MSDREPPLTPAQRRALDQLERLRLPLRASIAFVWLATGLISALVYPEAESLQLLADVGLHGQLARVALYGTAWFEVALGLATLIGWRVAWLAAIQLALMAGFMTILTVQQPAWWWHPFGPLTKNIPLVVATVVMVVLEGIRPTGR